MKRKYFAQVSAVKFRELRAVNIDINFDPVMDVNSRPSNPVIGVLFGLRPMRGVLSSIGLKKNWSAGLAFFSILKLKIPT